MKTRRLSKVMKSPEKACSSNSNIGDLNSRQMTASEPRSSNNSSNGKLVSLDKLVSNNESNKMTTRRAAKRKMLPVSPIPLSEGTIAQASYNEISVNETNSNVNKRMSRRCKPSTINYKTCTRCKAARPTNPNSIPMPYSKSVENPSNNVKHSKCSETESCLAEVKQSSITDSVSYGSSGGLMTNQITTRQNSKQRNSVTNICNATSSNNAQSSPGALLNLHKATKNNPSQSHQTLSSSTSDSKMKNRTTQRNTSKQIVTSVKAHTSGRVCKSKSRTKSLSQIKGKRTMEEWLSVFFDKSICDSDNRLMIKLLDHVEFCPTDDQLLSALLYASTYGHMRLVKLLLSKGINMVDRQCTLALLAAVENRYPDIAKLLVKKGVPVNGQNTSGKTALMLAAETIGCVSLVSFLLNEHEADPNIQDSEGNTAFLLAVTVQNFEAVYTLLTCKRTNVTLCRNDGKSFMHLAKRNGGHLLKVLVHKRVKISGLTVADLPDEDIPPMDMEIAMRRAMEKNYMDALDHLLDMELILKCKSSKLYSALSEYAARKGYINSLKVLAKAGADLHHKTIQGETLLELVVKAPSKSNPIDKVKSSISKIELCVAYLLENSNKLDLIQVRKICTEGFAGQLLKVRDRWPVLFAPDTQSRVLGAAIESHSYELVEALIEFGVDINTNVDGKPPLLIALQDRDIHVLTLLLEKGANANILYNGESLLHAAVCARTPNSHSRNELVNGRKDACLTLSGWNQALHRTCKENDTLMLNKLLEGGCDINQMNQEPILTKALKSKNWNAIEFLLKKRVDINLADQNGVTPLMVSLRSNAIKYPKILVSHRADVNLTNKEGYAPLSYALKDVRKIILLVESGADVNNKAQNGVTALMDAVIVGSAVGIEILIDHGASVNAYNNAGDTPLHLLVSKGRSMDMNKVDILLKRGANINAFNKKGESPVIIAAKEKKPEFVKRLIDNGAQVNFDISTKRGQSWNGHLGIVLKRCNELQFCDDDFIKYKDCLKYLLEAGCSLHSAHTSAFTQPRAMCGVHAYQSLSAVMIACCLDGHQHQVVKMLVQSGIPPGIFNLPYVYTTEVAYDFSQREYTEHSSHLCFSILVQDFKSVCIFTEACYYHKNEAKMLQTPTMSLAIKRLTDYWPNNEEPPPDLTPNNWSLKKWSRIAISRAVGFGPTRGARVQALPIPTMLKDMLLCKNI